VDRQWNDRLGRSGNWEYRFKHRRKILRLWSGSDTHANTFSDPNSDSYADGNCDTDANADSDGDCNGNGNAYGYSNGYSELHAQVSTDSETSPDARAASVGRANPNYCSGIDLFAPAHSIVDPPAQ
jgi:hypothetical protein